MSFQAFQLVMINYVKTNKSVVNQSISFILKDNSLAKLVFMWLS